MSDENIKMLKYYKVKPEHINKFGKLKDDNTPLYPFYAHFYGFDETPESELQEHFNDPYTYDNNTSRHPEKVYNFLDAAKGKELVDFGPNVKRGSSGMAYLTPERVDKMGTDKNDVFEMFHEPSLPKDNHRVYVNPAPLENVDYEIEDQMFLDNAADMFNNASTNDFINIPVIATAKKKNLINIGDTYKDNYVPQRDDVNEVTVKTIDSREIPSNYKLQITSYADLVAKCEQCENRLDKVYNNMRQYFRVNTVPEYKSLYHIIEPIRANMAFFIWALRKVSDFETEKKLHALFTTFKDHCTDLLFLVRTYKPNIDEDEDEDEDEDNYRVIRNLMNSLAYEVSSFLRIVKGKKVVDSLRDKLRSREGKHGQQQYIVEQPSVTSDTVKGWFPNNGENYSDENIKDIEVRFD